METIHHFLLAYGAVAIFVCIYFESMGVPLPGESAIVAASLLAASGSMNLATLLPAIFLGAVLGDCTGYAIGRYGGRRLLLRYGHFVKLTPERLASLEDQFRRRGVYIVMSARFVVILRQLNGLIAGSAGMKFRRFLLANIVGAAAWTAVWGAGPYLAAEVYRPLVERWEARGH